MKTGTPPPGGSCRTWSDPCHRVRRKGVTRRRGNAEDTQAPPHPSRRRDGAGRMPGCCARRRGGRLFVSHVVGAQSPPTDGMGSPLASKPPARAMNGGRPPNPSESPSASLAGPCFSLRGQSFSLRGQSFSLRGQSFILRGQSFILRGQSFILRGQCFSLRGQSFSLRGQSFSLRGQCFSLRGQSFSLRGQCFSLRGQSFSLRGQSFSGPSALTRCLLKWSVFPGTAWRAPRRERGRPRPPLHASRPMRRFRGPGRRTHGRVHDGRFPHVGDAWPWDGPSDCQRRRETPAKLSI